MIFKQSKFEGYDQEGLDKFYKSNFKQARKIGKSDMESHKFAALMIDTYIHQFKKYS